MTSADGIEELRRASPGSAGRNRTLAISRLEKVELAVPTIEQQWVVVRTLHQIQGLAAVESHAEDLVGALPAATLNQVLGLTSLV